MDRVVVRRIAPGERRKLRRLKRQQRNAVNRAHARVILLSSGRVCNREIAKRVGYTIQWVRTIIHRFNDRGLKGIEWYPYWQTRGPRRFLAEVVEEIAQVALSSPQALIGMTQWSLRKLREYLVSQRIIREVSISWLRELLRRHGVRWRRTKTWKESQDPDFAAKYHRLQRLYRKCPTGARRICVDEFGPLNLRPHAGHCFAKSGHKPTERLRATYRRTGGVRHFFAAYDLETGRLFGRFESRKTWREFLSFLRYVRRTYPREVQLYIVLDNYGPHKKQPVLDWAEKNNVTFVYTPTNASWLNRIECQFTELRKFTLSNSDYRTHEEMQKAIRSFLRWRNHRRKIAIEPWRNHQATAA
jgi:transposase